MYRRMAAGALAAGLKAEPAVRHACLIVVSGMALQAELPPFAPHQQHAIGAAVRGMANGAAFYLQRRVFMDEWPALFRVAVDAGLRIRLVQAGAIQRAMRIVAVAALHQALRDAMVYRQRKLRLHRAVAVKAQRGLGLLQQTAVQPAHLVGNLRHLEKVALWRTQVALALVFDFSHQVRGVALVARKPMGRMGRMLKKILLLAAGVAKKAMRGVLF